MNCGRKPYNDYANWVKDHYGRRMQKISIDAGFTCPNRDGSKSREGCDFCNNSFVPIYCEPEVPILEQVEKGTGFFKSKYPGAGFLAYFQNYSNTYAPIQVLKSKYQQAISHELIDGLVISTRPDCVNDEVLDYIAELSKEIPVQVEFGIESTLNATLQKINRHHTFEDTITAFEACKQRGLVTGGHLILGLPCETWDDFSHHAKAISKLPMNSLKLHQCQVLNNTRLASTWNEVPDAFKIDTIEEYIKVVQMFLEQLRPDIKLERFVSFSPQEQLLYPKWGLKNFEFVDKLIKSMKQHDSWQGKNYSTSN